MMGTVTFVGLDVHARSTHGAAVDVMTGELTRVRFGEGLGVLIAWLGSLPGPVWACYEAGPTGFGVCPAATEAGLPVDVIAPGKTRRGPSDLVKSDSKDAEVLARCLMATSTHGALVALAGNVKLDAGAAKLTLGQSPIHGVSDLVLDGEVHWTSRSRARSGDATNCFELLGGLQDLVVGTLEGCALSVAQRAEVCVPGYLKVGAGEPEEVSSFVQLDGDIGIVRHKIRRGGGN